MSQNFHKSVSTCNIKFQRLISIIFCGSFYFKIKLEKKDLGIDKNFLVKKDKAYEIAKLTTKLRHLKLCGMDRGRKTSGRD